MLDRPRERRSRRCQGRDQSLLHLVCELAHEPQLGCVRRSSRGHGEPGVAAQDRGPSTPCDRLRAVERESF